MFKEIGPFNSSFDGKTYTIDENPLSWHNNNSLLFIDSPVGTGKKKYNTHNQIYLLIFNMFNLLFMTNLMQYIPTLYILSRKNESKNQCMVKYGLKMPYTKVNEYIFIIVFIFNCISIGLIDFQTSYFIFASAHILTDWCR